MENRRIRRCATISRDVREQSINSLPTEITLLSPAESNSTLITTAVRRGYLVRPAPRVVMSSLLRDTPAALIHAIHTWNPDAVITGPAALHALKGMPAGCPIHVISPAPLRDRENVRFIRTALCPELVIGTNHGSFSNTEIAVLVSSTLGDMKPACEALRRRWITTGTLAEAVSLLPANSWLGRRAPQILADLADNPWSVAELDLHRLLRSAGISGWTGNPAISFDGNEVFHPDIAFFRHRLSIEVDSVEFHSDAEALEDRVRRTAEFLLDGWQVVSVTPSLVRESPETVLNLIRSQLAVTPMRRKRTR